MLSTGMSELTLSGRVFLPRDEQYTGLFNYVLPAENVLPRAMPMTIFLLSKIPVCRLII